MDKEPNDMLNEQTITEAEAAIVSDEALVEKIKVAADAPGMVMTSDEFSAWLAGL